MSEMTDDVIQRVRRISAELRPGVLDDLGPARGHRVARARIREAHGHDLRHRVQSGRRAARSGAIDRDLPHLPGGATNVARHAQATHVDVRLDRSDRTLSLEVHDDGEGISAEAAVDPKSLGLLGIRERARRLGGTASVKRASGGGTNVTVEVPLERRAP